MTGARAIAAALLLASCTTERNPGPTLAQLCARHGGCDAGAPTIDELRAQWYDDEDGGAQ